MAAQVSLQGAALAQAAELGQSKEPEPEPEGTAGPPEDDFLRSMEQQLQALGGRAANRR